VLVTTAPCAMLYVPAAMKVFTLRPAEEVRPCLVIQLPLTLSKVVAGEPPEVRNSLPSGMPNVAVAALRKVMVTTWLVTATSAPAAGRADIKSSCVTTVEMISDVAGLLGVVNDVTQTSASEAAGLPVPGHTRGCRGGGGEWARGGGGGLGGGGECGGGCDGGRGGGDVHAQCASSSPAFGTM